ncbi:MAG: DUF433 domain-containing protein [Elusimicrobia bacterium]|nr:DUF433 domain-containing protein [Elusimicrobiota bacterium]
MNVHDYISVDPEVCHGKPCFKGTRIMVSLVLEMLESGQTVKEILEAYPKLSPTHVQAALHLASQLLDNDRFVAFKAA